MRSPGLFAYLGGNLLVVIGLWAATLVSLYECMAENWSAWLPILFFVAAGAANGAHARVVKYRAWKREWQAMGGETPKRRGFNPFGLIFKLSGFGLIFPLIRLVLRLLRPRPDGAVSLCRGRPLRSPSVANAFAALPVHCAPLLPPREGVRS